MKPLFPSILVLILSWVFFEPAFAMDPHLQDYAQVISPDMTSRLEKSMLEIETKKGLYIEEVILPSRNGNSLESLVTTFLKRLDNVNSTADKRVLLLIIVDDKIVKLYASSNLSSIYPAKISNDIIQNVILRLNDKQYDEMVRIGMAGIYHYYDKSQSSEKSKMPKNLLFYLVAIAAMLVVAYISLKKK